MLGTSGQLKFYIHEICAKLCISSLQRVTKWCNVSQCKTDKEKELEASTLLKFVCNITVTFMEFHVKILMQEQSHSFCILTFDITGFTSPRDI